MGAVGGNDWAFKRATAADFHQIIPHVVCCPSLAFSLVSPLMEHLVFSLTFPSGFFNPDLIAF